MPFFSIIDSHFTYSDAGFEDLRVWNKVEAFVCLKDSVENYDFCRLMFDSFLLENCKNDG